MEHSTNESYLKEWITGLNENTKRNYKLIIELTKDLKALSEELTVWRTKIQIEARNKSVIVALATTVLIQIGGIFLKSHLGGN